MNRKRIDRLLANKGIQAELKAIEKHAAALVVALIKLLVKFGFLYLASHYLLAR